jgi:hypothetical protein
MRRDWTIRPRERRETGEQDLFRSRPPFVAREYAAEQWEPDEARVSRPFRESAGVKLPRATHPIVGFERRHEAEQFLADLKARLARFGLNLHPENWCCRRWSGIGPIEHTCTRTRELAIK